MTHEHTHRIAATAPDPWRAGDLVDFEVFLAQDERSTHPQALRDRDRNVLPEVKADEGMPSRSRLFLHWVRKRRSEQFRAEPAPGEQVESFLTWAALGLVGVGLALSRAVVWSFFRSPETAALRPEPVNVFWYMAVCIGLPLIFTAYGFWLLLGQRSSLRLPRGPAFLRGTLLNLLRRPVTRLVRKISDLTGAEKRLAAEAAWGAFRRRAMDGGGAMGLKLASVAQILGLSFALGIVIFSAIDCLFYSRVFGWQSTAASITPESAHRFVRIVAAPWSWAAPAGTGYPTLEQVTATRFVRFQDPAGFPPEAASAWANFLVAAVFVYAFVPRALLYFISLWQLRRALAKPDFSQARYDRLWERLTIPHVAIGAPTETGPDFDMAFQNGTAATPGSTECLLVMPEELISLEREHAVSQWLAARKQWHVKRIVPLTPESAQELSSAPRAVLIHESFMPPVKSILKLIKQLRTAAPETGLTIALIGKPSQDPLGAPPSRTDYDVWHAKLLSLGDSNIDFFSFREPQL